MSKSLEAACLVQDRYGAGVVMPAYKHTVVVKKNPLRSTPSATKYFWGKSSIFYISTNAVLRYN
jgi:hypothetical protein